MIWAFVDYENVGTLETLDLGNYQRLTVFLGPRHRKVNLGEIPTEEFSHLDLIRMESTGKNNLDFHLAFYLGVQHWEAGKDVRFHIVSNDTGFDGVIQHLASLGRTCKRVGTAKKKPVKKAAKKAAAKKAAKKVPTKKLATKKTTKKQVGEVSATTIVASKLKEITEEARPHTVSKLQNWIANSKGGSEVNAEQIYKNLKKAGVVIESGSSVSYEF